ncbi:Kinesin-like protein KIF19 [Exaiptasia diaphana]|nr:Kinesin-like protein KIF19 [Exaiptasia diaphana]
MPDKEPGHATNLVVALRVRPISSSELGDKEIIHVLEKNLVVLRDPNEDQDDILRVNRSREKQYVFDHAFNPGATQNDVYNVTTQPLIESVVTGYNATVFAYGATGAGKTYTMLGSDNKPGIMGLTLNDLFAQMESTKEDVKYKVTMSYLEIYNEMIRDLLNPASGILDLREDAKGVNVAGLSEVEAKTTREVMSMLLMGNKQRTSEPTAANKTSSRSHAVLQVTVSQKSRVENVIQEIKVGKLFMIDLAGSERAAQTKNRGKRMIEGAHINRSLLALGNCINALSENRGHYVNYRDSKLTRLLKDSLGGNCKTVMIAHVSPAGKLFEESKNTLLYADRAKNIKTTIKRNQFNVSHHIAQYTSIITDLRKEIFRLKNKIAEQTVNEPDNTVRKDEEFKHRDHTEMNKLRNQLVSTFREQMEIRHKLMELEDVAMQIAIDTNRYMLVIDEWEQEKARRISKAAAASKPVDNIDEQDELQTDCEANKLVDKNGKQIFREDDDHLLTEALTLDDIEKKDLGTEKEKSSDDLVDESNVFALTSIEEPEEVTFAKEEIDNLVTEEKKVAEMKANLQNRLAQTRKEIERLEELLPQKISGEENREILGLILKVHELEISNAELQSQALLRENVLRYKDLEVNKYESRQKLCDEIIQMQRAVINEITGSDSNQSTPRLKPRKNHTNGISVDGLSVSGFAVKPSKQYGSRKY